MAAWVLVSSASSVGSTSASTPPGRMKSWARRITNSEMVAFDDGGCMITRSLLSSGVTHSPSSSKPMEASRTWIRSSGWAG